MAQDASVLLHYLAPLQACLEPDDVTELVINRPGELGLEREGGWEWRDAPELTETWLLTLARAAAAYTAQDVTEETPICSTVLPKGERCQIVLPPAAERLSLTLRKPSGVNLDLDAFARNGLFDAVALATGDLSAEEAELLRLRDAGDWPGFFRMAVESRRNILISGATGSGKTTFAKGLVRLIPAEERLLTIEDARELAVPHRNAVHMLYAKDGQGLARIGPKQLLESALRMRPDRILLQELPAVVGARVDAGRPLSDGCTAALADFCSASENTFASIKQTITARMNLWLNPRVCAATDASDFDLRDLRSKRMSLYLGVSPDNMARVAPLYNLLLQQLVDLNTRERPSPDRHRVQVLMVMDEFARLGHASVIAHGFSYVAGYGLRLLPVLQSPAQLRAEYGPDLAEEIMANCGVEIAFAPKELKVAQDLSERLGYWTYKGRSRNRPSGLSGGRRSVSESDQRRALMMPQELIQMPPDRLIVLRAGMPPIMGRKIVYWRERAFTRRILPPPEVKPHAGFTGAGTAGYGPPPESLSTKGADDMDDLRLMLPDLEAAGLEPLPAEGATEAEVEAWVDRFIDASVQPQEIDHGR